MKRHISIAVICLGVFFVFLAPRLEAGQLGTINISPQIGYKPISIDVTTFADRLKAAYIRVFQMPGVSFKLESAAHKDIENLKQIEQSI